VRTNIASYFAAIKLQSTSKVDHIITVYMIQAACPHNIYRLLAPLGQLLFHRCLYSETLPEIVVL
jgi:hypothetical protein